MQSIALLQLAPAAGTNTGGCCSSGSQTRVPLPSPDSPTPVALAQHPSSAPARAPQPATSESRPTPVLLQCKRLVLNRARASEAPRPRRGVAAEEVVEPPPMPAPAAGSAGDPCPPIDLLHLRAVHHAGRSRSGLHKLYIDLHQAQRYKLKLPSEAEARVWHQTLHAYTEYREYGRAPGAVSSDAKSGSSAEQSNVAAVKAVPSPDGGSEVELVPLGSHVAARESDKHAAPLEPYYAYGIAPLYARAIQSCLEYIRTHRGFEREGLFRAGRSSQRLLRQILLNDGRLDGLQPASPPTPSAASLTHDVHVVAFIAKHLLRALPESILTNALMQRMFDATGQARAMPGWRA